GDGKDDERQHDAQLLAAQLRTHAGTDLRPEDAADQQQQRQHRVDRAVVDRLQDGDVGGDEDDLEERGAGHHRGRHAEHVDHRWHNDDPAADPHDRREDADEKTEPQGQEAADIELRAAKAHLEREAMHPEVLVQLALAGAGTAAAQEGARPLDQHQGAERAEQADVAQVDDELDLANAPHQPEKPGPKKRAEKAADDEDRPHLEIDVAAP